jgi:pyruvate ferredoxin oxidoreductase alpha subunit
MVGPEAFTEVRYLAHVRQLQALVRIPELAAEFETAFGRGIGGLVSPYRLEGAETVVVALGSVLGTIKDAADALRDEGIPIGVLGITTFRPFPAEAIAEALEGARQVVVVEKAFSIGGHGILGADVSLATAGRGPSVYNVIAGLGGRPITEDSLRRMMLQGIERSLPSLSFLDLDSGLVERELDRMESERRSGPSAENLLRDVGTVPARAS